MISVALASAAKWEATVLATVLAATVLAASAASLLSSPPPPRVSPPLPRMVASPRPGGWLLLLAAMTLGWWQRLR